jgi:hypothetical protein
MSMLAGRRGRGAGKPQAPERAVATESERPLAREQPEETGARPFQRGREPGQSKPMTAR